MGSLGRAFYSVGFWIRETGQALDRLGSRLQGNYGFQEQRFWVMLSLADELEIRFPGRILVDDTSSILAKDFIDRATLSFFHQHWVWLVMADNSPALVSLHKHRTLMNVFDKVPVVNRDAFVAPSASIIGDVQIGQGSSIWYGCVLRGDANSISIGAGTNIQDHSLVHVAKSNLAGKVLPTIIGDSVTVGHSAVLHGCTIEDEAFVGMGATLLDGVLVEKHAMVAAGALVRQNTRIPCGEVWGGNPARFLRKLTEDEMSFISQSALNYSNLAQIHAAENAKSLDESELKKLLHKKFVRKEGEFDTALGAGNEKPTEPALSEQPSR